MDSSLVLDHKLFGGWVLKNDQQSGVVILRIGSDDYSHYSSAAIACLRLVPLLVLRLPGLAVKESLLLDDLGLEVIELIY